MLNRRGLGVVTVGTLALSLLTACGGIGSITGTDAGGATPTGAAPATTAPPSYTADQLEQALLKKLGQAQVVKPPESGRYGSLEATTTGARARENVEYDPPRCGAVAQAMEDLPGVQKAPAAVVALGRQDAGWAVSEVLIALPPDIATKNINQRIPEACRNFRAKIASQWVTYRAQDVQPLQLGDAARQVKVTYSVSGNRQTIWTLTFTAPGYTVLVTAAGPNATRKLVERAARRANQRAQQTLG